MNRPRRFSDPAVPGLLLFAGLTLAGFVAIGAGWAVAARTLVVPYQVPALVSGALGGLALVIAGAGLFATQQTRRWAAREQDVTDALIASVAALTEAARGMK